MVSFANLLCLGLLLPLSFVLSYLTLDTGPFLARPYNLIFLFRSLILESLSTGMGVLLRRTTC